ncbi:alkene reductase [Flavimobilis marinus]|uniref:2,4-dienoyl-CoA reductase n=1 Tax=Flavimobilis marinus TaxID=285351 RepID=A0A1I2HQF2_9MICO|nr:alkene reductase [Flavimobilis marinus]GHG48765.1 alkene reductase [Flavimobilis marinus]SFF32324.1 2,4-dienoyl-CoA reductase [Flavimobilis marinus]
MTDLFSPATFGALTLANRIVMAPLTRMRSGAAGIPGDIVVEHYRQRASVGLIVSEGTYPAHEGQGFVGQPGLVEAEQFAGWRRVTDAVHAEGGQIVAQVMHAGRVSHPDINGGRTVVGPSAIAIQGETHGPAGKVAYPVPEALSADGVRGVVDAFVTASRDAVEVAGFDGVEIHSANGYLLHEFLSPAANVREDGYGGSPENRARLVVEVVTAVARAIGADRVGLRISPAHNIQDALETDDADVAATYGALVDQIAPLGLAYLSVLHREPAGPLVADLRARFGGAVIVNSGFGVVTTKDEAAALLAAGHGDAVAVGRPVLANPDLVRRWREDHPLNPVDQATVYAPGPEGYIDYPTIDEAPLSA